MAKDNCKRRTGNVDEKEVGSREKKMNSPVLLARGSQCPPPFFYLTGLISYWLKHI